jgi:DNA-binding winged helix-turn-helix (wHTH) protein
MARYQIQDLILDADQRRLRRDGRWLQLSERSLAALLVLIDAGPEGASFAELMDGAWAGAVVGEDTVKKRISLLRQEMGDRGDAQLIQSLRGRGYRIAVPVRRMEERASGTGIWDRRIDRRLVGGMVSLASVFIAVTVWISPASGLAASECRGTPAPLISQFRVAADDALGEHRQMLASQVEQAITDSAQMGESGPFRMSARLTMERGEPVLELTMECGDPESEAGAEAWVLKYSVDPERPDETHHAVGDLLAQVGAETGV